MVAIATVSPVSSNTSTRNLTIPFATSSGVRFSVPGQQALLLLHGEAHLDRHARVHRLHFSVVTSPPLACFSRAMSRLSPLCSIFSSSTSPSSFCRRSTKSLCASRSSTLSGAVVQATVPHVASIRRKRDRIMSFGVVGGTSASSGQAF